MLKIVQGNLLTATDVHIIAHQCNCCNRMGAGIAAALAHIYPEVETADRTNPLSKSDRFGTGMLVPVKNPPKGSILRYVANIYSQQEPGRVPDDDKMVEAMRKGFLSFSNLAEMWDIDNNINPVVIGVPYLIGCGIAGGDPAKVLAMLHELFDAGGEMNRAGFDLLIYRKDQ